MTSSSPSVGIGILNWNGKKFLEKLLPELRNLTYTNCTIYVIDNASSDDSVDYITTNHPEVKLILLHENYGFAKGYNIGFASMHEDYYLMMNSDVEVANDFIEPMVAMMEENKKIAIIQPKLLALLQPDTLEHGGAAGGMIDMFGYPFCRGRIFEASEKDINQYTKPAEIFWASGACSLIRKEAYWKVNGMYDYFFMHSEEIDLCWRLIAEGYTINYCPDSSIYHLGGGTLAYKSPRKTYLNFRNNIIMIIRNSPWYVLLWLLPFRLALDVLAAIVFLVKEDSANSKAVFIAYKEIIKWFIKEKNKFSSKPIALSSIPIVYQSSIVWQHYIKEVKEYSEL